MWILTQQRWLLFLDYAMILWTQLFLAFQKIFAIHLRLKSKKPMMSLIPIWSLSTLQNTYQKGKKKCKKSNKKNQEKNADLVSSRDALTGYEGIEQTNIKDIIVYDVPASWTEQQILGHLRSWGSIIQLSTRVQRNFRP